MVRLSITAAAGGQPFEIHFTLMTAPLNPVERFDQLGGLIFAFSTTLL
jgi:hypothetical protein